MPEKDGLFSAYATLDVREESPMESLILWLIKHPLTDGHVVIELTPGGQMVNFHHGRDVISPAFGQHEWEGELAKLLSAVRFYNDSIRGQELFRGRP